ncbi:MAG: DUF4019 domain-containing protein [Casimicrobiaceae bacterium]
MPPFLIAAFVALTIASLSAARAQTAAPPLQPSAPPATQPPPTAPPTEPPPAQPTLADDKESIEAAKKWLALLDTDKAGLAWDNASKQLKSVVKKDQFVAQMRSARKALGKLQSREAVKFGRANELPGAPAGDYSIIEFEAKYKNGKLTEQLVWSIEEGDIWRVAGYFYR